MTTHHHPTTPQGWSVLCVTMSPKDPYVRLVNVRKGSRFLHAQNVPANVDPTTVDWDAVWRGERPATAPSVDAGTAVRMVDALLASVDRVPGR